MHCYLFCPALRQLPAVGNKGISITSGIGGSLVNFWFCCCSCTLTPFYYWHYYIMPITLTSEWLEFADHSEPILTWFLLSVSASLTDLEIMTSSLPVASPWLFYSPPLIPRVDYWLSWFIILFMYNIQKFAKYGTDKHHKTRSLPQGAYSVNIKKWLVKGDKQFDGKGLQWIIDPTSPQWHYRLF